MSDFRRMLHIDNMVIASHPKIDNNVARQISDRQPVPEIRTVDTKKELAKLMSDFRQNMGFDRRSQAGRLNKISRDII